MGRFSFLPVTVALCLLPSVGSSPVTASDVVEVAALDGENGFTLLQDEGGASSLGIGGGIGDVDDDSVEDFAWHGRAQSVPGESIFVVFGRSGAFPAELGLDGLGGVSGFTITDSDTRLGEPTSVRGVGDVNGDGVDDFAVGVPQDSPASPDAVGFVIYGRDTPFPATLDYQDLDGSQGFLIADSTTFGTDENRVVIDGAGDVNGDGRDDFLVGSSEAGDGVVFVVYGRAGNFPGLFELDDLDGSNGFVVPGLPAGGALGRDVGGVGDVNGDTRDDFVIGDPSYINAEGNGRAWVIYGRAGNFPASLDLSTLGAAEGFEVIAETGLGDLGWSVAGGDVDGDGFRDVVLGAPLSDPGDTDENAGAAVVVYGGAALPSTVTVTDLGGGGTTVTRSGASLSPNAAGGLTVAAGDVNGDGTDDFVLGSPTAVTSPGVTAGMVYVVFGEPGARPVTVDLSQLCAPRGFRVHGEGNADSTGLSLDLAAVAGDGPGVDLLIGGSPLMDAPDGTLQGAAHVVLGAPGFVFSDTFEGGGLDGWSSAVP